VLPRELDEPIPELPVYPDGLLWQRDRQCQYTVRSLVTMRRHWREQHRWVIQSRLGKARRSQLRELRAEIERSVKRVSCQRLFLTRHVSQYLPIHSTEDAFEMGEGQRL
jgi:hypothetical protein